MKGSAWIYRTSVAMVTVSALSASSMAVTLGQTDDFEDGTTQNWVVNLLGNGGGAPVPENIGDGGPAGSGDNYMRLTSLGGGGAGSRLVVINPAQWSGNYVSAGVTSIRMDLNNMGTTDLNLRLLFEKVGGSGPTDVATSTDSVFLRAGSGWVTAWFSVDPSDLTGLLGSVDNAISDATVIRLFHNPDAGFPPPPIQASLGVDNIAAVPEPATLLALGASLIALRRRRKNSL